MAAETMPERIWAYSMSAGLNVMTDWCDHYRPNSTEYVLASTHQRVIEALREAESALEQAKSYVERDEVVHGRPFGTGNAIRAALSPRTAAMEHIAQDLAEEIEEETR